MIGVTRKIFDLPILDLRRLFFTIRAKVPASNPCWGTYGVQQNQYVFYMKILLSINIVDLLVST